MTEGQNRWHADNDDATSPSASLARCGGCVNNPAAAYDNGYDNNNAIGGSNNASDCFDNKLSPSVAFLRSFSIYVPRRFVFPPFCRYPPQTMMAAALP